MIFFNKYPDSATDQKGRNLGPIDGLGTIIPVVTCPNPEIGERCALSTCFNCNQYVRHSGFMLECKYSNKKAVIPQDSPSIKEIAPKKEYKKPTGVFDPTE